MMSKDLRLGFIILNLIGVLHWRSSRWKVGFGEQTRVHLNRMWRSRCIMASWYICKEHPITSARIWCIIQLIQLQWARFSNRCKDSTWKPHGFLPQPERGSFSWFPTQIWFPPTNNLACINPVLTLSPTSISTGYIQAECEWNHSIWAKPLKFYMCVSSGSLWKWEQSRIWLLARFLA